MPVEPALGGTLLLHNHDNIYSRFGLGSLITNETPSGTVDGSNAAFDTANSYVAGSIQVYRDGQLMKGSGADYTETDSNTITFTTAPVTGSVLLVSYQKTVVNFGNADTLDGQHAPTGTIVGTSDSQTLTNKTLTTPIINGAFTGTATPPLTFYGSNFNSPEGFLINGKIAVSVAANDLTVAIKGLDGNDPSASNPVYIG
jgi:hypothetical protein